MRGPLILLICALTGVIAGGWVGHSQASDAWPQLSQLHLVWTRMAGLALGAAMGLIAGWVLARRARRAGQPHVGWERAARATTLALVALPMALWLTSLSPGSLMRKAAPVHRMLGERRPNIILISIDSLRPDSLGCYGSTRGLTPNLDAFAEEATVYDAAYAPSSWTLASFGALFTGQTPSSSIAMRETDEHPTVYVERARLLDEVPLLFERLRGVGYRTAAELTNPFLTHHFGWGRGLEFFRNEDAADPDLLLESETTRADAISQNAGAWIRLNHYEPFLLWVHYLDPHAPYDAPGAADATGEDYPSGWETSRAYWEKHIAPASIDVQRRYASFCRERYAAEVAYVDHWFGRLLDEIRADGSYDDCLIAVFSDHGEELFEHDGFDHGHSLHEEVLRVPLIVKWPRSVQADSHVSQTVALLDLGWTASELAGCQSPDVESRAGLARVDGAPGGQVYSEGLLHSDRQTALTTDAWKLIHTPGENGEAGRFEVYDRAADRGEQEDLSRTDAASDLRELLHRLTEEAVAARDERQETTASDTELGVEARRQLESLGYLSD